MWDATAQVTLISLEGKKGVSGEVDGKSMQNCTRETTRTIRLFHSVSSKISPKVSIVISYLAGFGLLGNKGVTVSQVFRKMKSHLLYYIGQERIKLKYLHLL